MANKESGLKTSILLFLSLLLLGCAAKEGKGQYYRGVYSYGHEVSAFVPCNSDIYYWLWSDNPHIQHKLESEMNAMRDRLGYPYPDAYIEIEAIDEGKNGEGFPADYDARLNVKKLAFYSEQIPYRCGH